MNGRPSPVTRQIQSSMGDRLKPPMLLFYKYKAGVARNPCRRGKCDFPRLTSAMRSHRAIRVARR